MKLHAIAGIAAATGAYAAAIHPEGVADSALHARQGEGSRWPFGGWRQHFDPCNPPADLHDFEGEIEVNGQRRQFDNWADFQRELQNQRGDQRGGLRKWAPWLFPASSCSTGAGSMPTLVDGKHNAAPTQSPDPTQEGETVPEVTPSSGTDGAVPDTADGVVTSTPDPNFTSTSSSAASSSANEGEGEASLLVASSAPFSSSTGLVTSSTSSSIDPLATSSADPLSSSSSIDPLAPPTSDTEVATSVNATSTDASITGVPTSTEGTDVPPFNATDAQQSDGLTTGVPSSGVTGTGFPPNGTLVPTSTMPNLTAVPSMNATLPPTATSPNVTTVPTNGTAIPTNGTALPTNTTTALPQPTILNNSGSIDNPSVVEGLDKVRGVNLGGWLVYEGWLTADGGGFGSGKGWVDEWTMAQTYDQNREYIDNHWRGWVTEADFAEIAAAGLNTVRIPVGYWTFIPTVGDEPYRGQSVTWETLKKAFEWAKTYGLRVMLDMHAVPGPQSLDAHSGHKTDRAGFFFSEENKKRTIDALLVAAREFTQPKYGGVLKSLMLVNEPRLPEERKDEARQFLKQFYVDAHAAIRALPEPSIQNVTVLLHDSFDGAERYGDFRNVTGDPNVAMDRHLYAIFEPSKANWTGAAVLKSQCEQANALVDFARKYYTVMVAEFGAPARGDSCSWFEGVEGVQNPGQCPGWGDEPDRVTWVKESLLAQLQAYEMVAGWVFWTWKTANGDLGWDMRRIIDKILHGVLGVERFDQITLDRCEYYNASMPKPN